MTIEQIDTSKVLISLCTEDMKDFSLKFDTIGFSDPHSRKILTRLLTLACSKTGMKMDNKSMIVEALPHETGCLILLTITPRKSGKKLYKIKKLQSKLCYVFDDSEDFLNVVSILSKARIYFYSNSVYFYNNKYYLVFDYPSVPKRARAVLSEYASVKKCNKIFSAKLREYGKVIAQHDAIEIIGKHFSVKKA